MAISPPSDVVLGVALAADPQQYKTAAERLRRLALDGGKPLEALANWDATLRAAEKGSAKEAKIAAPQGPVAHALPPKTVAARPGNANDAFDQLEAFVLQSFIQTMLPKQASNVFGKGLAGDVWKSMMAEKLGAEIARSGKVGIARQLAGAQALALAGRGPDLATALDRVLPGGNPGLPGRAPPSLADVLPYLHHQLPSSVPKTNPPAAADKPEQS